MTIYCKQLNQGPCKTYMIGNEHTRDIVLIDPVIDEVPAYQSLIEKNKFRLALIIETHTHADHISGGPSLKDKFDCDYAVHEHSPIQCFSIHLAHGDILPLFDKIKVKIIHTPGHTADSVSLMFPDWLFTGDALFLDDGGAGRDDLPGGSAASHWDTLQTFHQLDDPLIVYPAHDYRNRQPASLGHQKQHNPHMQKALEGKPAFVAYIEDLKLGPADWMKDVLKANYACARDPRAAWIPVDSPACEVKGTMSLSANEVEVTPITAGELKQRLAANEKLLLLDVREPAELRGPLGSLPGALNIPVEQLSKRLDQITSYKDTTIISICRSGGRAYTAAQILTTAGFEQVLVLKGGMMEYQ